MSSLGERLKELRLEKKMTQQALCDAAGIGTSSYSRYEADKVKPEAEFLTWLHQNGFDILYILTGTRQGGTIYNIQEKIYTEPEQALYSVLNVQKRLGVTFNPDALMSAIGYAYMAQLDEEGIYQFVKSAYEIVGVPTNITDKNENTSSD